MMLREQHLMDWLQKYDVPGPRYTSYPTVPAWRADVGSREYARHLQLIPSGDSLSLYFHLPFCENLCHFCGCTQVITKDHSRSGEYLGYLLRELDQVASLIPCPKPKVSQIHFGGGTPNFFQPAELGAIVDKIRGRFHIMPDAEMAIEMHPRTWTRAFCDTLKVIGINRISLGVQDFDPKVQGLINRNQSYAITAEMVSYLRKIDLSAFNFDLVYGLPGQSIQGWGKTLGLVGELAPDRLAVYSYAHVPWVKPVQRTFNDADLPDPMTKLQLFAMAYEAFTDGGYRLIGMDHFAKSHDELCQALKEGGIHRNFMGYSTRADSHQIGFGMSGISYVGGGYFQNLKKLPEYYKKVEEGTLATHRGIVLTDEDKLRREVITELMCSGGIQTKPLEQKWGIDFSSHFASALAVLQGFVDDGLLKREAGLIKAMDLGFLFLRNMAMAFDEYLGEIQAQSKTPTFSRTV